MNQDSFLDKETLQILLNTLRKIGTNIQNASDQIVPELEKTSDDLEKMRNNFVSLQEEVKDIVTKFDSNQNQITSSLLTLKEAIISQNENILANKEAILSIERKINEQSNMIIEEINPHIENQTQKLTELVKNNTSEGVEGLNEFLEKQSEFNTTFNNEITNLSENILPSIIANTNYLGNMIVEIRRTVLSIQSRLVPSTVIDSEISIEGKEIQQIIQDVQQISYKTQVDRQIVLSIIDGLIETFSGKTLTVDELEGSFIKQIFINARTQVYEKTEGIAPRFRQAMDALASLFKDNTIYPISNLTTVVKSLQDIRKLYDLAPVISE